MGEQTKDWKLYEAGKLYNQRLEPNYYDMVEANWDFFIGNQWRNLANNDLPQPVFNVIKRAITFFVASLTTSKAKIHFEPMMYSKDVLNEARKDEYIASIAANQMIENLFEKFKMEFRIKDALFDAAITGDAAAHFYFDMSKQPYGSFRPEIKGEICMELVDGTNVYFGNANNSKVEDQPYIVLSGRDMVKNLQEEAKRYGNQETDAIKPDSNYQYQAGNNGRIEVEGDESGKAEYIIVYRKVKQAREKIDPLTGATTNEEYTTITASKSVENAYIYQDIDTGLYCYPIAWMNWEKDKNTYHGRAVCTGLLPNQIFINRMFAMIMLHLQHTAFPKAVYNSDAIDLWSSEVAEAIPVSGVDLNTNLNNIATYLNPSNMSGDIIKTIDLAMQYTKEMMGAGDAALGDIDPKNTSAIIAVQKSAAIPLENPKKNLYEWIEDIGKILYDMMGTYYGIRPVMVDGQMADYDYSNLKGMWMNTRADVGESSYWSEIATSQTLDNLLASQHIDFIEWLERQPDDKIPQKAELIAEKKEQIQAMAQQQAMMMAQQQQQAPVPMG